MKNKRFNSGEVIFSNRVTEDMNEYESFKRFVRRCLRRYENCDWGDTVLEDCERNDNAVINGGLIMAMYYLPYGMENESEDQLWIMEESSSNVTNVYFLIDLS